MPWDGQAWGSLLTTLQTKTIINEDRWKNMSEYINNRQHRQEVLKRLIRELHEGQDLEKVKQEFRELVRDVSATEISQMEEALIAEGLPRDQIKALCDVHGQVFRESLDKQVPPEMTPGHPVHTFRT